MAAKKILLVIDSDRFAFPLLNFLSENAKRFDWKIKLGSLFDPQVSDRIKNEPFARDLEYVSFSKMQECEQAIRKSDLIIALVQDSVLLQIADSCINYRKSLISPSRLNRQMALKKTLAKENNALILMDCGFSPGLDHIIAKKAIDNIHAKGGKVSSFKTYSGTFLAGSSEPNPWNFKLTEPAADLLGWGRHNNRHIVNGRMQHIPYNRLFERSTHLTIDGLENTMMIPEGDSLYYRKIYNLGHTHTVVKGRLVRKGFDTMWNLLMKLGLTDSLAKIDFVGEASFYNLMDSLLPYSETGTLEERLKEYTGAGDREIEKLEWLGLFDPTPWNDVSREITPAYILQQLLEKKFATHADDQDLVVMEHHLSYEVRDDNFEMTATLILNGEGETNSALAKVTGYTCGAAAKSVLLGSIKLKGIHIPVVREIYDPILNELEELGIAFQIKDKKFQAAEINSEV